MRNRNIFSGASLPHYKKKDGYPHLHPPVSTHVFAFQTPPAPNLSNMEHQCIFCETSETSLVWRLRQHCYTSN